MALAPRISMQTMQPAGRVMRRPQHRFQIRSKPWQIQPICIAPVLPGETLRNLLIQSRVVTDPIKNPLVGWWCEYYFFYVKHRDLDQRDHFTAMMLDPNYDLSSLNAAAKQEHYHAAGAIDWVAHCLNRVVDCYFRDEPDVGSSITLGNLPAAKLGIESWLDSVTNAGDMPEEPDVPEIGIDPGADTTAGTADDYVKASDVEKALRHWQFLRNANMTEMSYEDYLRTYGIRAPLVEQHQPELVRYLREWSYPSNTVNPADGRPSSAVSWSIAERADKDRFFSEPGFIFGVSVIRPKVYLAGQTSGAIRLLDDAFAWLPAVMRDDPGTSLKEVAASAQPLDNNTDAFVVDVRDLFLYGDQFVNFALDTADANFVDLPTPGLEKQYPDMDDANNLFVDGPPAGEETEADVFRWLRQDGVVSLNIAGTQVDHT